MLGEDLAARELRRRGWTLAGRRVRTPAGEVDLVARDGETLVLFEVKTGRVPDGWRGPPLWRPRDRLGPRQVLRTRQVAPGHGPVGRAGP